MKGLKAQYYKHTLNFKFDAGTSRGVLKTKDSYFIKIFKPDNPLVYGIGEAGPLKGLSPEFGEPTVQLLQKIVSDINLTGNYDPSQYDFREFSSVLFALETAMNDLNHGGKRKIFDNDFYSGNQRITINGLVWMGDYDFMKKQISEKLNAGFRTIKLKIGAIKFDDEIDLLAFLRKTFKEEDLTIRVDANGAFSPAEALEKLKRLSDFGLHSIEQPIAAGQEEEMHSLCEQTPLPIALDEEILLNGTRKKELLQSIKPQYIILKPGLAGGISGTRQWIKEAEGLGIDWWITSALESNIGLNAICQLTAEYQNDLPQGLGTGQLYHNNFNSPLEVIGEKIYYNPNSDWDLSYFK